MLSQESHRDHSMATKRDPNRHSSPCIRWKKKIHLGSSWTYQLLPRVLLHGGFEFTGSPPHELRQSQPGVSGMESSGW